MAALRNREAFEAEELERLAPYAARSAESRGRVVEEPEAAYRTVYQRDRDRIVHSAAFRRLEYKTQVFIYHEGDHYRNRLTHTLEASQIARTIARALRLNEELTEAVILAHDLGHTPFGHAGERVLAELMRDDGGFDHNRQSLRIVDLLEERYPGFRGLNLSYEAREGILKHGCDWPHPVPIPDVGAQPGLEAQVADHSDEIAYTVHDLDDGLRSGLLNQTDLKCVRLWNETHQRVLDELGAAPARVLRAQTIRALVDRLVTELVEHSAAGIDASGVGSIEEVRRTRERIIGFAPQLDEIRLELKRFLYENLYEHPRVAEASDRAAEAIRDLFAIYRATPGLLPEHVRARIELDGEARAVADYVAGMTDRFALGERERLK
ncbi:MAG: deoxyguanosinetriphosphate triphosphohydrolase [Myxococcota bacterium]